MHNFPQQSNFIDMLLEEQKKYSSHQRGKISNSNKKLDLLEQKMKSLLQRDKRKEVKEDQQNVCHRIQIGTYFEPFSQKNKIMKQEDYQNEDMLLQNNTESQNNFLPNNQIQNSNKFAKNKNKKQKSQVSLKIFGKKNQKTKENQKQLKQKYFSISNKQYKFDTNNNNGMLDKNGDDGVQLRGAKREVSMANNNYENNNEARNQDVNSFANLHNLHKSATLQPIQSHSNIKELQQLEEIMEKSMSIKQKQLLLMEDQLCQLENKKIHLYRRNVQLELQLQNFQKFKSQILNKTLNKQQMIEKFNTNQQKERFESIFQKRQEMNLLFKNLCQQLSELQQFEYKLKIQKSKQAFELHSLQRQFKVKINSIKFKNKKMKQNIFQNSQIKQKISEQDQQSKVLKKKYSENSLNKPKRQLQSNLRLLEKNQKARKEKYGQNILSEKKHSYKKLGCGRKSQKSQQRNKTGQYLRLNKIVYQQNKLDSQRLNSNRHKLGSCQYKNSESDKVLFEMVHQLDRLKQIVNQQLIKSQKKQRKVINLYDTNEGKYKQQRSKSSESTKNLRKNHMQLR